MLNSNGFTNISTSTIVRFFLVIIILAALYYLRDILLVVITAVVVASALEPIVRRISRYRIHRVVAVVFIYISLAAIIALILIFFLPLLVNDIVSFLSNQPRTISLNDIWNPIRDIG